MARTMVALEDAYGHHVVGKVSVSVEEAEANLLSYANPAPGRRLEAAATPEAVAEQAGS